MLDKIGLYLLRRNARRAQKQMEAAQKRLCEIAEFSKSLDPEQCPQPVKERTTEEEEEFQSPEPTPVQEAPPPSLNELIAEAKGQELSPLETVNLVAESLDISPTEAMRRLEDNGVSYKEPKPPREKWKACPNTNGEYQVSNLGRIRKKSSKRLMSLDKRGTRPRVRWMRNGRKTGYYVDDLVALAFMGPPSASHPYVSHRDGDLSNNRLDNLVYTSEPEAGKRKPVTPIVPVEPPRQEPPAVSNLEEWRPFPDFEGLYEISRLGQVRATEQLPGIQQGRLMSQQINDKGQLEVIVYKDGVKYARRLSLAVARAFIGPCPPQHKVEHKNGDLLDVTPTNLAYVRFNSRGRGPRKGEEHPRAVLNEELVKKLRKGYERGMDFQDLQKTFGYNYSTIYNAVTGNTWPHVR